MATNSKKDPWRFSGRFRQDCSKEILEFVKTQSNFSNAISYLIEKEIHENGLRDLAEVIPPIRSREYFENLLNSKRNNEIDKHIVISNSSDSEMITTDKNELSEEANNDTNRIPVEKKVDLSKIEVPSCFED